jgi:hypothetical protein
VGLWCAFCAQVYAEDGAALDMSTVKMTCSCKFD